MTCTNAVARIGENQGIVGYRAGLGLKHPQGMAPSVTAGSMNLGHAAKRIGILNVVFAVVPPGRTFGPNAYVSRHPNLTMVRTQGMNALFEGRGHSVVGKKGCGSHGVGPMRYCGSLDCAGKTDCLHELGSVNERKALLGLEYLRGQAQFRPKLSCQFALATMVHKAFANQGKRQVREGCQVARSSE